MKYDIVVDLLFSTVFLTILQIFSTEVTLIRDQGWITVDACILKITFKFVIYRTYGNDQHLRNAN